jgi:hypothetical protein
MTEEKFLQVAPSTCKKEITFHLLYLASDGGFDGDVKFKCSDKNPGSDPNKILFNLGCMRFILV